MLPQQVLPQLSSTFTLPPELAPHPMPQLNHLPAAGDIICAKYANNTFAFFYLDPAAITSQTLLEVEEAEEGGASYHIAQADTPWSASEYVGGEEVTLYQVGTGNLICLLSHFLTGKHLEYVPEPITCQQSTFL